ncbi:MAG: phosphoesterase [Acidobacteriota bacterium]|jgi:nanoRNase/pAp phosphatase (c-di-AMP/oligoRNAs hydrolase)
MKIRVLYHDHCFDGAASAAYFSRFLKETHHPSAEYHYTGMAHTADQIFADSMFDGDVNAIVDFKYSPNHRLTWWFDHHQSAFLCTADADHFQAARNPLHFFDPAYRSCTKFIRDIAREKFGYEPADLAELVHWADIIDGAQYSTPQEAVELKAAATKLVLVIEAVKGSELVQRIIRDMQAMPLEEIIAQPEISAVFTPLHDRHLRSLEVIGQKARTEDGVIFFDLVGDSLEGYNKFVPYYLFPDASYTVSVSESTFRTKVSVGSSPWAAKIEHNLASICERYGGGGHPRVGAISFPVGAVESARKAAAEIVAELRGKTG